MINYGELTIQNKGGKLHIPNKRKLTPHSFTGRGNILDHIDLGERYAIERNNVMVWALVPIEDLHKLLAMEAYEDE